ncbi:prolipoprotein diacylglyceryl transferase [Thermincola ferriacetica]
MVYSEKKLPFWQLADVVTPALALGYGIVRIGCFLNGCCYGKPTNSTWGVIFPHLDNLYRYPTQLYSSAFGMGMFLFLLWFKKRKTFDGQMFLLFLIIYGIERIIVEAFRENLLIWGPITVSQLISAFVILIAGIFYYRKARVNVNETRH